MPRSRSRFSNVFAPFIAATLKEFRFLVADFGFEHVETSIISYECSLLYRKAGRVAVTVYCEAGALPWVMLTGRHRPRPGRPFRVQEAAVDYVIEHRCPERRIELPGNPFPVPRTAVSAVLRQYVVALRECAADFLNGDPSVVAEVQPAVDAAYKEALAVERREERAARAANRKTMKVRAQAKLKKAKAPAAATKPRKT